MRKLILAAAVVAALAAAGAAVAHRLADKGIAAVSTSFTARPAGTVHTRSCTDASSHVWQITNAVYQGQATGGLAGNVTIRARSVVDTTTGNGFTQGKLLLRDSSNKLVGEANLTAVDTQKTALDGLVDGRVAGGRLIANFSGSLAADGTLSGSLGSGSGTNSAILYGGLPKCTQTQVTPPKPILRVAATVTAASSSSLTVSSGKASWTISVPASLATAAAQLKSGDRVEVTAAYIDGAYTLVTLRLRR